MEEKYTVVSTGFEYAPGLNDAVTDPKIEITLIGAGMGDSHTLTEGALDAINNADIILGRERLIKSFEARMEKRPFYMPVDIVEFIKERGLTAAKECAREGRSCRIAVLFSGDAGFYSTCSEVRRLLDELLDGGYDTKSFDDAQGYNLRGDFNTPGYDPIDDFETPVDVSENSGLSRDNTEIKVLPGISTLAYLAASQGIDWHDVKVFSLNGRDCDPETGNRLGQDDWKAELSKVVRTHERTLVLINSSDDIQSIGFMLLEEKLEDCRVLLGYELGSIYEDIYEMTPRECIEVISPGLYVCLITNDSFVSDLYKFGYDDREFLPEIETSLPVFLGSEAGPDGDGLAIRLEYKGTPEEARAICVSKLRLERDSVVYDIGSGSGAMAITMASLSSLIQVYALESDSEAFRGLLANCRKAGTENVSAMLSAAPEGLTQLREPTHVLIDTGEGPLTEILEIVYSKNPYVRVVVNAESDDQLEELKALDADGDLKDFEVLGLSLKRDGVRYKTHICSFFFEVEAEEEYEDDYVRELMQLHSQGNAGWRLKKIDTM